MDNGWPSFSHAYTGSQPMATNVAVVGDPLNMAISLVMVMAWLLKAGGCVDVSGCRLCCFLTGLGSVGVHGDGHRILVLYGYKGMVFCFHKGYRL
jgi:hypothetical protein